ncbi:hypothetical protein Q7I21_02510 [Aeromonas veronii]|uniref:hypothetical protein n=1 Tax=Aeromonas veronii TaxID=654 RepID=UPI0030056D80
MITFNSNGNLPAMAWCSEFKDSQLNIYFGTGVQVYQSGVFEGGWSNTDTPEQLDESGLFAGSGIFLQGGNVFAISPTHTCEAIYIIKTKSSTITSNSLALALSFSSVNNFKLSNVGGLIWTTTQGLNSYQRLVYRDESISIHRFVCCIVNTNSLLEIPHHPDYSFTSFKNYRSFLKRSILDIRETSRLHSYTCFLSKGYDSVACASLMKSLGGGLTMSIESSRSGIDDSGSEIAIALGLKNAVFTPKKRNQELINGERIYTYSLNDIDASKFCLGYGLEDECLEVETDLISGSVVLTGFHGDKIWDINTLPSKDIKRGDSSGSSLGEYRLRSGFVHIPVPMIGSLKHDELYEMSNSSAMKAWSIGGNYDRPIARRLAEEQGVPRESFGIRKSAVSSCHSPLSDILKNTFFESNIKFYTNILQE